jgi:hypothetical protein
MEFALQYPIGKFVAQPYSEKQKQEWLNDIWFLPKAVEMGYLCIPVYHPFNDTNLSI